MAHPVDASHHYRFTVYGAGARVNRLLEKTSPYVVPHTASMKWYPTRVEQVCSAASRGS